VADRVWELFRCPETPGFSERFGPLLPPALPLVAQSLLKEAFTGSRPGGNVRQRTLAETISCTGIGLHSGEISEVTMRPAPAGSGIVFVRSDLAHSLEIPVQPDSVTRTELSTQIGRGDVTVDTVEHLLAALYGLGIDNARVEVDGVEVPGMDGSAAPFVFLIRAAGVYEQAEAREVYRLRRPIEIRDGNRWIRAEASRSLKVSYRVDYEHPAIGRQVIRALPIEAKAFERDVARARTFGFFRDVESLRAAGRARGASLDNTVVLDDYSVMNSEGLRCQDEFVRHKILDLVGDLALLGISVQAHIKVERGGHALHHALVAELADRIERIRPEAVTESASVPVPEGAR
jgi:UDP-3-O-[3-hydroxymyristoyl] N-acetylglucosamine deacetylase